MNEIRQLKNENNLTEMSDVTSLEDLRKGAAELPPKKPILNVPSCSEINGYAAVKFDKPVSFRKSEP